MSKLRFDFFAFLVFVNLFFALVVILSSSFLDLSRGNESFTLFRVATGSIWYIKKNYIDLYQTDATQEKMMRETEREIRESRKCERSINDWSFCQHSTWLNLKKSVIIRATRIKRAYLI